MRLVFTGDTVFTGSFEGQETNTGLLSSDVKDFLQTADSCVCDIEGPICSDKKITDRVAIRSQPAIHSFLTSIHGDILFLGNNHILDYGQSGLISTLRFADENGYKKFGAGLNIQEASSPLILNSICGLLALRYNNKHARASDTECGCLIWDEDNLIKNRIQKIKSECKWCILVIHGGDEFCPMPLPEIRERYLKFLEWGADVIVAHHPHVVQNYEIREDKAIFYSLGNFVFDDNYMRFFPEAKEGVLLKLDIDENNFSWDYLPIFIDGDKKLVLKGSVSPSFFCIKDQQEYEKQLPSLIDKFFQIERKNIHFQIVRKDIPFKAKARIVLSHIRRYFIKQKKLKKYL